MIVGVIQARMSSTRLPGKVLADIHGEPMLARQVARLRRCTTMDELVIATSTDPSDDPIAALAADLQMPCVRGSLHNVLDRYLLAAETFPADAIVRLTADCPLTSPTVVDRVVSEWVRTRADYVSNTQPPTFPDGLDVEVVTPRVLRIVARYANADEREHVTLGVYRHPERFSLANVRHSSDLSRWRWTVDTPGDLEFVRQVYGMLTEPFDFTDIADLIDFNWLAARTC